MADKITTLKDKAGNTLYPVTLGSCVYGEDNIPLPEKANKDLSNTSYPEIIHDASDNTFDGIAHFGAGDRVIETYIASNGKTWYRKYASGWKECGIIDYNSGAAANLNVKLPITFSSTNYIAISYSNYPYEAGTAWPVKVVSRNANSVDLIRGYMKQGEVFPSAAVGNTVCVYCCGY
jgi:hypothetical protein